MTLESHPRFWVRPHDADCPFILSFENVMAVSGEEGLRTGESPEAELDRVLNEKRPACTCGAHELQAEARRRGLRRDGDGFVVDADHP